MPSIENDFILRSIEQLARFVAATMRRALGRSEAGEHQAALEELADSYRELFGLDPQFLHLISADQLLQALRDRSKLEPLAQLLETDAAIREKAGDPARSPILRLRAAELRAMARGEKIH